MSLFRFLIVIFLLALAGCNSEPASDDANNDLQNQDQLEQDKDNADDPETPINSDDQVTTITDVYDYLNELRNSAGMISVAKNELLALAAKNHTDYLVSHNSFGHDQIEGLSGFTGFSASDRANEVLYFSRNVGEGIAAGKNANNAIDNLFSAIYHRFTLLHPDFNEIGISAKVKTDSPSMILVHNIANSELNRLCQEAPSTGSGIHFTNVCSDDTRLAATEYNQTLMNTRSLNEELIVWPPVDGKNIPPVFFEETPDPLPDYSVSGYPVSVQYNSTSADEFILNAIYLYEDATNERVTSTRLLNGDTDPNQSFSDNQYALFPLQRLSWDTQYRVEISYSINGISGSKNWTFQTQMPAKDVIEIKQNQTNFNLSNGVKTAVYIPPNNPFDTLQSVNVTSPEGVHVEMEIFDGNTLLINASSATGGAITITLNDGIDFVPRVFTVEIST